MSKTKIKPSTVTRGRVMNAIYELAAQKDAWPTLHELSYHLKEPPVHVHERLNELVVARLFRERRVNDRQVWMPWELA